MAGFKGHTEAFKKYMRDAGCQNGGTAIPVESLDRIIAQYPWFSLARVLRERIAGRPDMIDAAAASRAVPQQRLHSVDAAKLREAAMSIREPEDDSSATDLIIERFLQAGSYRIVADDAAAEPSDEVTTMADFSDEDELVSEELAQIYMSQGLFAQAAETYRKLSLLNPKKSVYFAEIIDKIENNN